MTKPGPPGGADSPPTGPGTRTGPPESGTRHATSTDFALPLDEPVRAADPLSDDLATPPAARPAAPLYDEVAAETAAAGTGAAGTGAAETAAAETGAAETGAAETAAAETAAAETGAAETAAAETVDPPTEEFATVDDTGGAVYGEVGDASTQDAGRLGALKAFAAQRPAVFLGAVLAAGFLIGRLLSSSDDGVES